MHPKKDPKDLTILEAMYLPLSSGQYREWLSKERPYRYYDTPDGEDIDKKLWVAMKYGVGFGTFASIIDTNLYSNHLSFTGQMSRVAMFIVPSTAMLTSYAAISYAALRIRGKDDVLNNALGGAVAGSIYGAWAKSGRLGYTLSVILALAGAAHKHANDLGYKAFNIDHTILEFGSHSDPFQDSSLIPIGEKGWTTGRE